MAESAWITEELARAIHHRQLAEHGGMAGVRDAGLLSSALARPRHLLSFSSGQVDLPQLAAAYAFGIAKNHPFLDGNKRTAYVVCRTFLKINGNDLIASQKEKYLTFLRLAEGTLSEEELVEWIQERLES
jgi:death-on-curing protein